MKVLHVINTAYTGGAELHLLALTEALARRGVEVGVAFLRTGPADGRSVIGDFGKLGIPVYRLHANSRYGLGFLRSLVGLVRRERADILHTHLPRADMAGMIAAAAGAHSMARVASVHNIYGQYWSGRATLPLCRLAWRTADSVIGISRAVGNWLVRSMGVPAHRVHVIHYGLDLGAVDRRWVRGETRPNLVGTVARLERRKNHECLIRAMQRVVADHPSARLIIAGHDHTGYGPTLSRLISMLGLEDSVRLAGFERDVFRFLEQVPVFAFASLHEGFGLVILEAMAIGRPVVASDIPPLDELVVHGVTGFLADPNDPSAFAESIDALLRDPALGRTMGEAGRRRVEQCFSLERMAAATVEVYREVLRRPSSERAGVAAR